MVDVQNIKLGCILGGIPAFFIGLMLAISPVVAPGIAYLGYAMIGIGGFVTVLAFVFEPLMKWRMGDLLQRMAEVASARIYWIDNENRVDDAAPLVFQDWTELPIPNEVNNVAKAELFRQFVGKSLQKEERAKKLGKPRPRSRYCETCGTKVTDPEIPRCPNKDCNEKLPEIPKQPVPKTPDEVVTEINAAIVRTYDAGGITVCRGKTPERMGWASLEGDGNDYFEECCIVVPRVTRWADLFKERVNVVTPFILMGALIGIRAHCITLQYLCNYAPGCPLFVLHETNTELIAEALEQQASLSGADVAITAMVSLNGAAMRDKAVGRVLEDKQEAIEDREYWEGKFQMKRLELKRVTDQTIKLPKETVTPWASICLVATLIFGVIGWMLYLSPFLRGFP